ncbi:hypothetical protein [Paraburkholderia sp. J63]|uniref:hypothetical protein n=1 Tax=Paraburkholderia sp. J63 TaxID=2805434 RepID=UPI002ABE9750|nr:hypothetical protein [Paraburkholderia sp. J63]
MKNYLYERLRPEKKGSDSSVRHLNPLLLFILIYIAYNGIGLIDTPWTIAGAYDKTLCWELFLTGLAGASVALVFWGGHREYRIEPIIRRRTSRQLTALFFLMFTACLASAIFMTGGIPLFAGEERFGNSALAFNLIQLYGFWALVRTISSMETGRRVRYFHPILYMAGALCFGYRTPILIFVFVIFVYLITFKVSRGKGVVLGFCAILSIVIFSAVFAAYRVSQSYDFVIFFKNIDFRYINDHKYLLPFVPALAMFDFSQNTISTIGSALHEHMYGQLLISNYETFLPGKHWGARNIIGAITSARWIAGRPMSITPTLQGALYVDFGYVGVFFGFFLIVAIVGNLWRLTEKWSAVGKFSFCYLLTLSIMAIHNGYWDAGFVFFLFFLLIIRIFDLLKTMSSRKVGGAG